MRKKIESIKYSLLIISLILFSGLLLGQSTFAYNESPMWEKLVEEGELPPVEERLPEEPAVVEPTETIGQYGGEITVGIMGAYVFYGDPQSAIGPETLVRLSEDYKGVAPGIAKDFEFQDNGKVFVLELHEDIKWSDGEPFTADDILFWYEDILLNEELTPTVPKIWRPGGEVMEVKKIDEYTVQYEFAVPYSSIQYILAHYNGSQSSFAPKHYLKQIHPNYVNEKELSQKVEEEGFDNWYQLFEEKNNIVSCIPAHEDLPTLSAYKLVEESPNKYTYERNPYYWKVDPDGNQLPYIDRVNIEVVEDREMLNMNAIQGNYDIYGENALISDYPLYRDNQEGGGYELYRWKSVYSNQLIFQPNQTADDPVLRDIFREKKFRIALSLGIDREDINQSLYFGLGKPMQTTVLSVSSYYKEEFAESYIDYDPERANNLLDEIGLDERDSSGWRLRPDGEKMIINIEYPNSHAPAGPVIEIVQEFWEDLGIQVNVEEISNELQVERATGNEINMTVWYADKSMDHTFLMSPMWYVPYNLNWETTWGVEWARWYTSDGEEGEEPPAEAKRLLEIWDEMKITVDQEKQIELGQEILSSQAENLWTIGTVGEVPVPIIINENLKNVPEEAVHGYDTIRMQPNHPEQFFFDE